MIAPGNKLALTDLQAVATTANGATSSTFDLTNFLNVSPMLLDLSGNNYGYRNCHAFLLTAGGSGYLAGDQVKLGTTLTFTVVTVTASGAVLGLIVTGNSPIAPGGTGGSGGTWPSANDPSPGTLTTGSGSGSGSGAAITFSVQQVGPTANYSFPDYSPVGTVTGLVVTAGGTGYSVSDSLTLAELPGWSATVATVSSGVITSITFTASSSPSPLPTTIAAMSAIGGHGTGAKLGGQFIVPQRPQWLTELNRLRTNLWNVLAQETNFFSSTSSAISGPWPISGPNLSCRNQVFWFPDTGSSVSIPITVDVGDLQAGCYTEVTYTSTTTVPGGETYTYTGYGGDGGMYGGGPTGHIQFGLIVGGGTSIALNGYFYVVCEFVQGGTTVQTDTSSTFTPDMSPTNLLTIASTLGGATIFMEPTPRPGYGTAGTLGAITQYFILIPVTSVAPGSYLVTIDPPSIPTQTSVVTGSGPTSVITDYVPSFCGASHQMTNCVSYAAQAGTGYFLPSGQLVATRTDSTAASLANGIDNAKNIYTIPLSADSNGNNDMIGYLTWGTKTPEVIVAATPPTLGWSYTAPTYFSTAVPVWMAWTIGTLPLGMWTGNCQPISSLNIATEAQMPWNLLRTRSGATSNPMLLGTYNQSLPVEQQQEPPAWAASTYFPVGFTIIDTNGNLQQCTAAGTSGSSAPSWPTSPLNATVTDGAATWKLVKIWSGSFVPAQHRVPNLPRYPVYWQSETLAKLKPPTGTSGPTIWGANNQWQRNGFSGGHDPGWQQDNQALGWWIYSVSVNRINPGGAISVTIGCIRSGSFVSFATFNTGTTHQVLWPVFTSDALVYQCSERVDIQALALAGSVTTGTTVSAPMCAAFLADVQALLGLI
jgi:hypothetical protein